jgi:hypothetical protein
MRSLQNPWGDKDDQFCVLFLDTPLLEEEIENWDAA